MTTSEEADHARLNSRPGPSPSWPRRVHPSSAWCLRVGNKFLSPCVGEGLPRIASASGLEFGDDELTLRSDLVLGLGHLVTGARPVQNGCQQPLLRTRLPVGCLHGAGSCEQAN